MAFVVPLFGLINFRPVASHQRSSNESDHRLETHFFLYAQGIVEPHEIVAPAQLACGHSNELRAF
jgi:hypothetical protein